MVIRGMLRFVFILILFVSKAGAGPVEFRNQVFAGYQGWFAAPGDGSLGGWNHWSRSVPSKGNVTFELYPDVREYHPSDLFQTSLGPLGGTLPAKLFASDRGGVVDLHFKWMAQYGIDGVGLQRFANEIRDPRYRLWRDGVAAKVRASAEKYRRSFYLTYDISGGNAPTLVEDIQKDFTEFIEGRLRLPHSPAYARQGGRPVVGIWGFGFGDRPGNQEQCVRLVRWFQSKGYYVIGGVPWHWRNEKPWIPAWMSFNMIQPWAVGSYANIADIDSHASNIWPEDVKLLNSHGVDYQRVIFPGFAWSNWNGGKPNMIPRRGGQFFWRQAFQVAARGMSAFIAMFDEYDEGTAIAKAAENRSMIPDDQPFLTLDADGISMDSDFYLRLSGAATLMIKERRPAPNVPVPFRQKR